MNLRRLHQAFHAALAAALVLIAANPAQARQVDYQYDALNRLVAVIDAQGTTSFEYDAVGNRTAVDYPNGLRTEYGYDARDRLIEQTSEDAAGNLIAHYRYTLDETGQRIRLEEPHSGRTADWSYDELGRLTEEAVTDPSGGYTTSWTYDQVGNRLTQTEAGQTTGYTYDDNDRLLEEADATGITTYTYDANGNLTHQSGPQGSAGYGYDQENRLVSATTAAGSLAYTYDADGIRQSKTENGLETRYLVDPNQAYAQVLAEYDSFGNEIAAYTRTDHHLIGQDRAGSLRYYHQDGLGSTRLLTDGLGSLTDSYDYAAFGELDLVAGTTENEFLFTGEQYDPALELYYLRARWMDPGVGRFTQQDSWQGRQATPITLQKYLYAGASPVNGIDPSGKFTTLSDFTNASQIAATQSLRTIWLNSRVVINRAQGKAFEGLVESWISKAFSSGALRGEILKTQFRMSGPGGTRVLDLLVRIKDRLVTVEAKTNVPTGGGALGRLVGQIKTASNGAGTTGNLAGAAVDEVVIVSKNAWQIGALERIAARLGTGKIGAIVAGEQELIQVLRLLMGL